MQIGVVFPQTEIGADPAAIRDFAQAAESLAYDHILVFDHVLGANVASRPGWQAFYTHKDMFHEPFVLYGFLSAATRKIGFAPCVIILPQRQTALVAKQAAAVDVLSGGRLRLGVGLGWNHVEYEALGENFNNRGARAEEQVEVMRLLWTQELVTFEGKWHKITDAGLNPLPFQRPIPIWFGGVADGALKRIARIGDGWFPLARPDGQGVELIAKFRSFVREAGRDPASIGIEGLIQAGNRPPEEWIQDAAAWKELGATHISVNTMKAGHAGAAAHIDAIRRFSEALAHS